MGYVYPEIKTEKKTNLELEKLKKDLYNYEKTILRIDDTVNSSGKNYKMLRSLAIELKKGFNILKKYPILEELPNTMQIEKTLDEISDLYSNEGIKVENHKPKNFEQLDLADYILSFAIGLAASWNNNSWLIVLRRQ